MKYSTGLATPQTDVRTACVLHILDHSWPVLSGYSVRSRDLITSQSRLGQDLAVVTGPLHQVEEPSACDTEVDGVAYFRTAVEGRVSRLALQRRWPVIRELQVVRLLRDRILQLIDEHNVRIIYAHSPALCGLAGLQAARKRKLPFVYEVRAFWEDGAVDQNRTTSSSLRYSLTRGLETYVVRNADAVCGIAEHIIRELRSRGVAPDRLFHTPNGVDCQRFVPMPRDCQLADELGLTDAPVLGFFGSLYRYEGITWLIQAVAELRRRGNRFNLLIIGRGEEQERVRAAVHEHALGDCVRLIDHVPHDQISRYYSVADVMVFPRLSVRLTELVTPLKPLEAMSLKKAVLASGVGGMRELIEDEHTGLLFPAEDIPSFCDQAERLLKSAGLRAQLGDNAREYVLREKDWNILARRYQDIYEHVLQGRLNLTRNHGAPNALIRARNAGSSESL
ncbi:MAG: glycosyltransferase [Candidatus Korobacteraceae bacterium]